MVQGLMMKITKFEHACFVVEQNGQSLIVDPGRYTTDLVVPDNVVAVVVTHNHADHYSEAYLHEIIAKNPDAVIIGLAEVTSQFQDLKTQSVVANEGIKIGEFELEFFGGQHAVIISDIPIIGNIGVMINNRLYYPGDSFTVPDKPVEVLALPVSAPWMKFSESIEFLRAVKPKLAFPTHDAILSDAGKNLIDTMAPGFSEKIGAEYKRLVEPLEI
jgi:L-ascorbate metabolism protein UlaG (beta-lactamase superfamily)